MFKKVYLPGFLVYGVLLFFSIHFSKERIVFIDMACNLFYILQKTGFTISHYRFADAISQLFPLAAIKAGLPLSKVIDFYSAGYIVYSLAAYIFCGSALRRYDFAFIVLLQNVLFASDTFYVLSQLPQAITLVIVMLALLAGKTWNTLGPIRIAAVFALLVTLIFFHPLSTFALFFALAYFLAEQKTIPDRRVLLGIAVAHFFILAFKIVAFHSRYESHSMSGLKNFVTLFPNYITLYSHRRFLENCCTRYYWIPVLFTLTCLEYGRGRQWFKLSFFAAAIVVYIGLVDICYPTSATQSFYIENLYLPLAVLLSLPLVFEMPGLWRRPAAGMAVFALICATGLIRIYTVHNLYSMRLNYYRQILDKYGDQKIVLNSYRLDKNLVMMNWGTPCEFLMLSEAERNKAASIIVDDTPRNYIWTCSRTNQIIVNWENYYYRQMPSRYFHFTDSVNGYTVQLH